MSLFTRTFPYAGLVDVHSRLWCQTAEEWGNPVYIQSVRKKVPLRDLSLSLASQTPGTLATINYKPDPYCLLLARSTNHKNLTSVVNVWFDRRTIRFSPMVRGSYIWPDFLTTNLTLYWVCLRALSLTSIRNSGLHKRFRF